MIARVDWKRSLSLLRFWNCVADWKLWQNFNIVHSCCKQNPYLEWVWNIPSDCKIVPEEHLQVMSATQCPVILGYFANKIWNGHVEKDKEGIYRLVNYQQPFGDNVCIPSCPVHSIDPIPVKDVSPCGFDMSDIENLQVQCHYKHIWGRHDGQPNTFCTLCDKSHFYLYFSSFFSLHIGTHINVFFVITWPEPDVVTSFVTYCDHEPDLMTPLSPLVTIHNVNHENRAGFLPSLLCASLYSMAFCGRHS